MIYVVIKSELETSERTHELVSSLMETQMATYRNTETGNTRVSSAASLPCCQLMV